MVDYRIAINPYESRYGADWEDFCNATTFMSQYICVTTLIEWIVEVCTDIFKGSTCENDWVFYHDALSQMTAKDTIKWMKEKDYYRRWILPVNGLHQDQEGLRSYWFRPVGDHPENMPWDNNLNQDVHLCVNTQVMYTTDYDEEDERKFSLSTPKRVSYAYRRVLHPRTGVAPSSARIIQDVNKVLVLCLS